MRILFIGDIVGRPGRRIVAEQLPRLRAAHGYDAVLANAENAAGGLGATPEILDELRGLGVDGFTLGNHTWRKKAIIPALETQSDIVRPANYPDGVPGRGETIITLRDGRTLGLVSVLGRVYMESFGCPFVTAAAAVARLRAETPVVLVDMHAEATSEKVALGWHLDGTCTAVVGTHTHVPTADGWVLPGGTAYVTDIGMCGPQLSVIGTQREAVLQKFITGMPKQFEVAQGPAMFCAVAMEVEDSTGRATSIASVVIREPLG